MRGFWQYRIDRITRGIIDMVDKEFQPRRCKYCGSLNIVRYGHYKHIQRLLCRDCGHKFVDNDALPGMRVPTIQIASALGGFYEGLSLNSIRRQLEQTYHNYPSDSTVYEWITRFTKEAISLIKDYTPIVGDVWIADETVLKIGGENIWFWDCIDDKTRFLLASHMSLTRTTQVAKTLMESAERRANKVPKIVITDKLRAYLDGIELAFGADTKHIQSEGLRLEPNTNLIERFHGTLKARTKVMRGLKNRETAKLIMDGWLIHYNFFRPHESLKDKTPAQKAGIKLPFKNWLEVVQHV